MIGVVGKQKRIFSKRLFKKKQFQQLLQDGNREWISLLACVCADGTALPSALIYPARAQTRVGPCYARADLQNPVENTFRARVTWVVKGRRVARAAKSEGTSKIVLISGYQWEEEKSGITDAVPKFRRQPHRISLVRCQLHQAYSLGNCSASPESSQLFYPCTSSNLASTVEL